MTDRTEETAGAGAEPSARRRISRGMRTALYVCGLATLVHLIPIFLPRNTPEQALAIARVMVDTPGRVHRLKPLKEHPKATGAELREAAELLLEGAPAEARELVEEAERREPNTLETQLLRARICQVERMDRCVQESFERAARMAPGDARTDLLQADMREEDGDVEGALEAVARALKKAPGEPAVMLRHSRLLSELGRFEEAEAALRASEQKLPAQRLYLELGLLRTREGRNEEARRFFAQAVGEGPQSAIAHFHLGMAHFYLGDVDSAEEELRTADRLDVSNPKPLAALCAMQMKASLVEAARVTKMDLERRFQGQAELIREACRAER